MALFGRKQKEEKKEVPAQAAAEVQSTSGVGNLSHVLRNPRITEKATERSGSGTYTFDVDAYATKRQISEAVKKFYGVTPRMVRVVTIRSKVRRNARSGKMGIKKGGRKAYVYLKSGEQITIA